MRFTLFSIDLSVTISMVENYQKMGAKCSSEGNLKAKIVCTQRLKIEHWRVKSQQKSSGGRKSEIQTASNNSSFMNYYLNHQAKRIISEALTSEIPTLKHPMLKSANGWWSILILTPRAAIITPLHRRPVKIMHIIHSMHTLAFICCEILALYGKEFWLYRYSVTNIQN